MDMEGSRALAITQQQAWDALCNPEVLKACIPGCDKVEVTGENRFLVGMAVKVGPVAARFSGRISLGDMNPPESYTILFDGQGGAAGFGKGKAQVRLAPRESGCEIGYNVHAQVGGKIAQVGQRLIDGVARSMADDFFRRFDEEMQRRYPEAYPAEPAPAEPGATPPGPGRPAVPAWVWAAGAGLLLALWWWLS